MKRLFSDILWDIIDTVILGKGMRILVLVACELCIFIYAGYKFFSTTGTEHAVYLLILSLSLFGDMWFLYHFDKTKWQSGAVG